MKDLRRQARVTAFLRSALAEAPQDVVKLEAMARTEGLLGDRQRITHAKPYKRVKYSLRIRSGRASFGTNGGWRWELPCDRDGASTASPVASQPVRAERCIPVDWVEGVDRLNDYPPPTDIPRHRWRQFVSDCQSFLNSSENWAERTEHQDIELARSSQRGIHACSRLDVDCAIARTAGYEGSPSTGSSDRISKKCARRSSPRCAQA